LFDFPDLKEVDLGGKERSLDARKHFMNITSFVLTLLVLATCAPGDPSQPQSCNPAVVNYIVRDEGGKVLSEAELKSIYEQLPKSIGDAHTDVGEVSFADDGKSFYWPESVDWKKVKGKA